MSASYPYPIIAREGWPFVAAAIVAACVAAWLIRSVVDPILARRAFHFAVFPRSAAEAPGDSSMVVSPADGRVVAVGRRAILISGAEAIKVSVFMNVFKRALQPLAGGR